RQRRAAFMAESCVHRPSSGCAAPSAVICLSTPRSPRMNDALKIPQAAGNFWKEYAADEWTDAVVAAMKLGGVDHLYFVSGTELAYYQEAITKAEVLKRPAP